VSQSTSVKQQWPETLLESFVHRGKANARNITRARILLKAADGWSTAELAGAFDV
jgi:hypothetical protein